MSKRKKRPSKSTTAYQSLEVRKLLASISFDSGTLTIGGSQDSDNIVITERADGQTEVELNDRASEFFASDSLQSVRIFSQEGNDDVVIQRGSDFQTQLTNLQTVFVSAGEGNDFFSFAIPGASADVTAIGDLGNDNFTANQSSFAFGVVSTNSFSFYGNEGDDVLGGGGGNDLLSGQAGNDRIFGQAGDDALFGGTGNDILNGGDGVDRLFGGDGDDSLLAGSLFTSPSNDVAEFLVGGGGNDTINGGNSIDRILGGEGRDMIYGNGGDDAIYGGEDRDIIYGGQGDDLILGQNGNDQILGEEGMDRIYGNEGRDDLQGGLAADQIFGGTGADSIMGELGDDFLYGGDGNDSIVGGEGDDIIAGHGGDDKIEAGSGDDRVFGGEGDDLITGFLGADLLAGQAGDDVLSGQQGSDFILGGDGNDRIEGGRGFDRVAGNDGIDTFIYPESDRISDFDATSERMTSTPYLDRYLGLTLEDANELAASNGLLTSSSETFFPDLSFTTDDGGVVKGVINQVGISAYTPQLSDFIGSNSDDAIETAASYGLDISTFDISAGQDYSVIEPENPLRFLTANGLVLGVDGPRGDSFINAGRLVAPPRTDLYIGLTRSEATILAEANGNAPLFSVVDGELTGDSVFQSFSRIIFHLEDGRVSQADGLNASDV